MSAIEVALGKFRAAGVLERDLLAVTEESKPPTSAKLTSGEAWKTDLVEELVWRLHEHWQGVKIGVRFESSGPCTGDRARYIPLLKTFGGGA